MRIDNLDRVALVQVLEVVQTAPGPSRAESIWPAITATPGWPGLGAFSWTTRPPSRTVPSHHATVWMLSGIISEAVPGAPFAPVGTSGARTPMAGISRSARELSISATKGLATTGFCRKGLCTRRSVIRCDVVGPDVVECCGTERERCFAAWALRLGGAPVVTGTTWRCSPKSDEMPPGRNAAAIAPAQSARDATNATARRRHDVGRWPRGFIPAGDAAGKTGLNQPRRWPGRRRRPCRKRSSPRAPRSATNARGRWRSTQGR